MTLKLFDDFARTDNDVAEYSESMFHFLNHSALEEFSQVREVLEEWFENYDASEKKRSKIRGDFRSDNDQRHLSAFFEIYLYSLFRKMGYEVTIEPDFGGRKPDFLLTDLRNDEQMIVEATGTYPNDLFGAQNKLEATILDKLNTIYSPDYFLVVEFLNESRQVLQSISPKKLKSFVQKLLADYPYDDYDSAFDLGVIPKRKFRNADGIHALEIGLYAKRADRRGMEDHLAVGGISYPAYFINPPAAIRNAVKKKYRRYGDIPYVVALNNLNHYPYAPRHVMEALFGDREYAISWKDMIIPDRVNNGEWYQNKRFQKRGMSGLLVFGALYPHNMFQVNPVLWKHPKAKHTVNRWLLSEFDLENREIISRHHPNDFLQIDHDRMR